MRWGMWKVYLGGYEKIGGMWKVYLGFCEKIWECVRKMDGAYRIIGVRAGCGAWMDRRRDLCGSRRK